MKRGFTLIELPIVVAIIAILAAIAVPNFLEAQLRGKVRRGEIDLRTAGDDPEVAKLAQEVSTLGWLLFAAESPGGDLDIFMSRPGGSDLRNLTNTPGYSEFGPRFSPDLKQLMYRRLPVDKTEGLDLRDHSFGELIIAQGDGTGVEVQGKTGDYPWATWSPEGKRIACLYKKEGMIRIFDLETKKVLEEMPRQGIFWQLVWSPDGKQLCGTANIKGANWNIVRLDLATKQLTLLTRNLNCTPNWFHDSARVIYSSRMEGLADQYGWTMEMQAQADGSSRKLIYGERAKHVYFGELSPDDKYAIFSILPQDGMFLGPMAIVRMSDTPLIPLPEYRELEALYPQFKRGPVLRPTNLPEGSHPQWVGELKVK